MSSSDILVVGAGCFGLSTALHLKRRGIENVQLIDRLPFPSRESASTIDTSRIIRADYVNPFYAKLGQEALEEWRNNPTFSPAFHETGWILAALPGDPFVLDSYNTLKGLGATDIDFLDTQGVRKRFPGLNGNLDGSDVYYNPRASWANARQAMQSAMAEFVGLGGKFLGGNVGDVISILADSSNRIIGVQAKDANIHRAAEVIVCTGASTPQVVDTGNQIHPMGFCLAHWRLDAREMVVWKDHPVVDLHHNEYFFPPNEEGLMKLGYGMSGYQRYKTIQGKEVCIPWWKEGIPAEAEAGIRSILRKVAPSIADKPFSDMRVCWDGITGDAHWLITERPKTEGLFIAAGGSGHGFKFLPIIGSYIADLLQGKLDVEFISKWQWRKGTDNPHVVIQGRSIGNLDSFPEASKSKI